MCSTCAGLDEGYAPRLVKAGEHQVAEMAWGRLHWYASAPIGNADFLTVGRCIIEEGQQNPRHYHPNCEEVLQVLEGHILHSFGDETFEMHEGDVIVIPPRVIHNAKNLGTGQCVLAISFSSADRRVVNLSEVEGVAVDSE
jgi:quercetin dioxygenase-like cupin family protein